MAMRVLVPVADGIEEIEAVTIIDVLRRAGADVTVASVSKTDITGAHGIRLTADRFLGDCVKFTYELIALPGGMPGAENLRNSGPLKDILKRHASEGGMYAAICASPAVVLKPYGLLKGKKATAHPCFAKQMNGITGIRSRVVVDGNCITSQGPGTAMEFALALVEALLGKAERNKTAGPMLVE